MRRYDAKQESKKTNAAIQGVVDIVDGPLGTLMKDHAELAREFADFSGSAAHRERAAAAEKRSRDHEVEMEKAVAKTPDPK